MMLPPLCSCAACTRGLSTFESDPPRAPPLTRRERRWIRRAAARAERRRRRRERRQLEARARRWRRWGSPPTGG